VSEKNTKVSKRQNALAEDRILSSGSFLFTKHWHSSLFSWRFIMTVDELKKSALWEGREHGPSDLPSLHPKFTDEGTVLKL